MRMGHLIVFFVALTIAMPVIPAELKLPKEVTPALRAACETDVRRLCIDLEPDNRESKELRLREILSAWQALPGRTGRRWFR